MDLLGRFPGWYLKAKGWIAKREDGMFAIRAEGVDHTNSKHRRWSETVG
jgi:hypothetical protein